MNELTPSEIERYSRHLILPEVGLEGQERLKGSSVLIVGAGGLGSPLALYLAAAGIGRLGLVDFDSVEFSNLQRQIIHTTRDVGRPKLESAREKLEAVNPEVRVECHSTRLASSNALEIVAQYDLVADGSDNFPTRYLVNDACVLVGRPNVFGSIFRFEGQASVFAVKGGPCYRCLFPQPPPPGAVPSCAEGGVLGVLPGLVGTIQAIEAIKIILGKGEPLIGRMLVIDALAMSFRRLKFARRPDCPVCGDSPEVTELIDYQEFCGLSSRSDAIPEVDPRQLKREMDDGGGPLILDVRNPEEDAICRIPGSLLIPLRELESRVHELDLSREIVVYCRSGTRSAKAVAYLQGQGFRQVRNLSGGILAWVDQVDPSLAKY